MTFTGLSWYAAPDGSPAGDGSAERPWDIATALRGLAAVEPGDIVWLRGGVYRPQAPLECLLQGSEENPIQVWGDPDGDRAVLEFADGRPHGIHLQGAYVWYGDFEIRSTAEARWSDTSGSLGNPRGRGLICETGPGIRLIRLTVRDFGTSLFESQPSGIEILGCTFSNSYWDAPDRSHGPGLYIRNSKNAPRKRIVNNVVFQHGRQGLQGFGSTPFSEMDVIGNTLFNNGIAGDGFHRNFMFGNSSDDHWNVLFEDNTAYFPQGKPLGHEANQAGGDGGSHRLTLSGNWIAHQGRPALRVNRADEVTIEGNRFLGDLSFSNLAETVVAAGQDFVDLFPSNAYYGALNEPTGIWARVRRDETLPDAWRRKGRAIVTVLNWELQTEVDVDLSSLEVDGGLEPGATLTIRSVQNASVAIGRPYSGEPVQFPMTGWTPAWPAGREVDKPLPSTFPELGVFTVEWPVAGTPADRDHERIPDPGAGLPQAEAHAARMQAWRTADPEERDTLLAIRRTQWRAQTAGRIV